mgnify:CR=1 FL=1
MNVFNKSMEVIFAIFGTALIIFALDNIIGYVGIAHLAALMVGQQFVSMAIRSAMKGGR